MQIIVKIKIKSTILNVYKDKNINFIFNSEEK